MRVSLGGSMVTDDRTKKQLDAAVKILGHRLRLAQGSYRAGQTAASGSTHDGGGVIDVATKYQGFSRKEKLEIVAALRTVGFAAWLRPETPGVWGEHIHAVSIGCPDLSSSARAQAVAFRHGYDGLAGEGGKRPDPQASLGIAPTTWEEYRASLKPQRGVTTVRRPGGTTARLKPGRDERPGKHRKTGAKVVYTRTKVVVDPKHGAETWLFNLGRQWVLSRHTQRGA